jgi:hypothetical protein
MKTLTDTMRKQGFVPAGMADQFDSGIAGHCYGFYLPEVGLCHLRRAYFGGTIAVQPYSHGTHINRQQYAIADEARQKDLGAMLAHLGLAPRKPYDKPEVQRGDEEAQISALCARNPYM